jgi:hypothetical protein
MPSSDPQRYFEPVARLPYVPRLELAPSARLAKKAPIDWSAVGGAARSALIQLEADIKTRQPSTQARYGTTSGGAVKVFSYCALSLPSRDEAIVAGLTVIANEDGLTLRADVCGEDSGRIFLQETPHHLETEEISLIAGAAANLAARLTRRVDEISVVLCCVDEA